MQGFFLRKIAARKLHVFYEINHIELNIHIERILVGDFLHVRGLAKRVSQILDSVYGERVRIQGLQDFSRVVSNQRIHVARQIKRGFFCNHHVPLFSVCVQFAFKRGAFWNDAAFQFCRGGYE